MALVCGSDLFVCIFLFVFFVFWFFRVFFLVVSSLVGWDVFFKKEIWFRVSAAHIFGCSFGKPFFF